jgi:hypothetical protein
MTHRRRASLALAALAAAVVAAPTPARAVIPSAEKVRAEIARTNTQAGRAQRLALEVAVTDETGQIVATGRAMLDPAGTGRLDLVLGDGRREQHERSPAGYRATREGAPIDRALPLLPPAQLLQARTEAEVAAALVAIGGSPEQMGLGMAGGGDCWVLGGRDPGPFDLNTRPSYWFDQDGRRPVRIDDAGGVRFLFGPPVRHAAGIFFPAWYLVEAPGRARWRVDVQLVAPAGAATGRRPLSRPAQMAAMSLARAGG